MYSGINPEAKNGIFVSVSVSISIGNRIPFSQKKKKSEFLFLFFAVLKAGVDNITVTWGLNQSLPSGTDSAFKTVKVKLCYAPISQVDRAWRKTVDELDKDKTCQLNIVSKPYSSANAKETFTWTIERDVPGATYFVRAYAYDSNNHEVAYGQTTDAHKTTNLFEIQAITGRHLSLDIASVCFSAFSVVSLFGFFYNEKRKAKRTPSN